MPCQAAAMDPRQRLLLESAYAARFAALGQRAADSDDAADDGVYVGITDWDAATAAVLRPGRSSVFDATGSAPAFAAGRVSFSLGLTGASLTVDTACSSALVALDLACTAIGCERGRGALVASVPCRSPRDRGGRFRGAF